MDFHVRCKLVCFHKLHATLGASELFWDSLREVARTQSGNYWLLNNLRNFRLGVTHLQTQVARQAVHVSELNATMWARMQVFIVNVVTAYDWSRGFFSCERQLHHGPGNLLCTGGGWVGVQQINTIIVIIGHVVLWWGFNVIL